MASIRMISDEDAPDRVKAFYDEVKGELGIDFVPNLYRAMAPNTSTPAEVAGRQTVSHDRGT